MRLLRRFWHWFAGHQPYTLSTASPEPPLRMPHHYQPFEPLHHAGNWTVCYIPAGFYVLRCDGSEGRGPVELLPLAILRAAVLAERDRKRAARN